MTGLVGRVASGLVVTTVLLGACTNDGSGAGGNRQTRADAMRDRRDVPVPSITNPGGSSPDRESWHRLWRTTPGTPEQECVDVGDRTDVRSGDFVAGNFALFIEGWDGTSETSKLYYIPAAPVGGEPVEVVAELLDDVAPQEVAFTFAANSWTLDGIPFYASGTVLPTRGHWRLTANAGDNSGCFELAL